MYTPPGDNMPPLVDNPPFIPPPHGASNGGEPGFFDAFPGARGGGGGGNPYPSTSPWAPPGHTPYPTQPLHLSPWSTPSAAYPQPPHSAPASAWPYGGYTTAGAPVYPPATAGHAPASPWGPPPALGGGGGGGSPYYQQWTPGGYTTAGAASAAFPGMGTGPGPSHQPQSPYAAPGTPFDSAVGQPITGGWFGRGGGGGGSGGGGGGWGDTSRGGGWDAKAWDGPGWDWHADERWAREKEKEKEKKKKQKRRSGEYGDDWDAWETLGWDLRGSSMKRSNSQGPHRQGHGNGNGHGSRSRSNSLHRSSSWGNANAGGHSPWTPNANLNAAGGGTPEYAQGDMYDENNLAKRPRDWRSDYNPRQGLASVIPMAMGALGRSRSTVKEFHDTTRRQIHPLFDLTDLSPALSFSLRAPPTAHSLSSPHLKFFRLSRPHNPIDLLQLATRPATPFMRIMHPKLPWYIDVVESRPNGVLVGDVLEQVHRQLHASIRGRHYWNDVLGPEERREIAKAFEERVRAYGEGEGMVREELERGERERSAWGAAWGGAEGLGRERVEEVVRRGILQVDFLGSKFWLEGLVRGPRGVWEMKTAAAD